jgi:hypothetical protein
MINITQLNPITWSLPTSTTAAPVAAVAGIRPMQESARHGQPGADREPRASTARAERGSEAGEAARKAAEAVAHQGGQRTTGRTALDRGEAGGIQAGREAEQNTKQRAAEKVAEAERSAQRQELLVNVWKASAAVVDQVLGREDATAINPAAESQATAARQLLEQPALPWPVMPPEALASVARVSFPSPADVVAYDQRGHSSLAPLEPGALISRRV